MLHLATLIHYNLSRIGFRYICLQYWHVPLNRSLVCIYNSWPLYIWLSCKELSKKISTLICINLIFNTSDIKRNVLSTRSTWRGIKQALSSWEINKLFTSLYTDGMDGIAHATCPVTFYNEICKCSKNQTTHKQLIKSKKKSDALAKHRHAYK